ncbi:MAG TPA: antibiotic biosynthesis monooxygenase family protein [Anaerolineales bacterium]|nr:antibiotic biosynthesis monooxygenase family protein [Anaerolineales bacterium]
MFVMVSKFQVRPGEEDAFVALHEDADRQQRRPIDGLISRELLADMEDPSTFVALARYRTRQAAESHVRDPAYEDWYKRLISLSHAAPDVALFRMAWPTE